MQRTWLGTLVVLALAVSCAHALVLGIDLGSQWYKLAMVRPGSGFDIVLNEQSARKTHTMVGWNKNERAFGSDAFNLQARYPAHSYAYLTPLLGKSLDHPLFEEAKEWITFNVVEDPERNSFSIQHDAVTNFKPEELVAMILRHAKELATTAMGTAVKDCVITVPPYLTQHERQAILDAADIAGLKVLSLINDITAFALNYAKDRTFDDDTQNVIFFDVGATSTSALLATFQSVADIKSKNKTVGQMLVRSVAWDQTLGGRFLDRNLANHFKRAIKAKYPDFNVDDVKFTLRMLREAQKIKEILSANQVAQAQLVGLGDNDDIALTITRKEFEELNKEIAARVVAPLQRVLDEAGLNKEDIAFVELVGGTSRVPFVQAALKDYLGREELDRHVNGDEGAALGAAFFAASLSSTFKVKEVRVRDITPYPVNVKINLDQTGDSDNELIIEEGEEGEDKANTALLHRGNKLNTRKALTFYSYSNFSLDLSYSDPDILPRGSKSEISHIVVSGMPSSSRYNITAKPKVHASFKLTSNGTVILDHTEVELTVLEAPKPKATPKPKVEKTEEAKTETEQPKQEGEQSNQEGEQQANAEGEQTNQEGESNQEGEQAQGEEGAAEQAEKAEEGEEAAAETETTEEAKTEEPEFVKRTFKLPLKIASVESLGVKSLGKSARIQADMRLSQYDFVDKQRKELEREKNNLESYIYETRDKLYNDDIVEASTEEERESLSAALSAASDWLEENSESATTAEYKEQSKILKDKADKIYFRIKEQRAFPRAAAELQRYIDLNRDILQNITELLNVTEEERDNALLKLETIASWLKTKQVEQFALAKNVDPAVTSEEVSRKQSELEFTTKMLLRKPKKKKPVEPKVKLEGESETTTEETTAEEETAEKTEKTETPEQNTQEEPTEKKEEKKETPKKEKTAEKKKPTTDKKTTKDKNTNTKKDKKDTKEATKDEL